MLGSRGHRSECPSLHRGTRPECMWGSTAMTLLTAAPGAAVVLGEDPILDLQKRPKRENECFWRWGLWLGGLQEFVRGKEVKRRDQRVCWAESPGR